MAVMHLKIIEKLWVQQNTYKDEWVDCQPGHDNPDEAREHVRLCRDAMPTQFRVVHRTTIIHEDVVDQPA